MTVQSRLSERVSRVELSGIREMFDLAAKTPDVIRLEAGEPDFNTPKNICDAAEKAARGGLTHYTSSKGTPDLRRAISEKMKKENGIDADPDSNIIATAGASCAVYLAIMSTIEAGEEVLIPDPSWPHYQACVELAGGAPVRYGLDEDRNFGVDLDELQRKVTKHTKMMIIASPSNPTGAVMNRAELESLAELACDRNLFVLSDEVYEKIMYDGLRSLSTGSLPEMANRTITVNSFSKTYAMTGWRLGYAIAPPEIIKLMEKLSLFVNSCPSSVSQAAGVEALTGPQDSVRKMLAEYSERRKLIVEGINRIQAFSSDFPRGAFYLFPNVSSLRKSSWDFSMSLLKEARVATVPGSAFGQHGEGFVRISFANSKEKIREALARMEKFLGSQGKDLKQP
jgi:aminotransferase